MYTAKKHNGPVSKIMSTHLVTVHHGEPIFRCLVPGICVAAICAKERRPSWPERMRAATWLHGAIDKTAMDSPSPTLC